MGSTSGCRFRDCKFESQLSYITLVKIDHEIISVVILTRVDTRRTVVSYWRKYAHKVLVTSTT